MNFNEALRTFILDLEAVYDIVGSRMSLEPAPQKTAYPYITFTRPDAESDHHLTGISNTAEEEWEINCFALDWDQAEDLKEAIRRGLDMYHGVMGDFDVYVAEMIQILDQEAFLGNGKNKMLYRKLLRFNIRRSEAGIDRTKKESEG